VELFDLNLSGFLEKLHPLVYLGCLLLFSYAGGQLANYFKVPRITGYIIMGMLLSPSVLGLFRERLVKEELALITHIALAIIAFSIGGALGLEKIKSLGKQIVWITFTQAFGAFLVATAVLVLSFPFIHGFGANSQSFWNLHFPMVLVIGAICAATAPAAILAIVHQYKAKGSLTTLLLGVVALDDALTIIFYAFAASVAQGLLSQEPIVWQDFLIGPSLSILISLSIGGSIGALLWKLDRFAPRREAMLGVTIGFIFLTSGLAISLDVSPLLANMILGFMTVNFAGRHQDLFAVLEDIEEPIFGMFFTLAGAHLDLRLIHTAGWLALLITAGRFAGKLIGSRIGAQISHAPPAVKKYLGLALLPTAGVTVGLVLEAKNILGDTHLAEVMVSAVLGSVIINELVTPFLVRFSLFKAGEAVRS